MAGKVSIQITGVPELMKSIDHLTKGPWRLLVRRSVDVALEPVKVQAAKNARKMARDTGLLANSLKIKKSRYLRATNQIVGKVAPESKWHAMPPSGGKHGKLGKKGSARFTKRVAGRKTRTENPAKYAHFTEAGTVRGVQAMYWMRQSAAQSRLASIAMFVRHARKLLPKAVEAAAKKNQGIAQMKARLGIK